MARLGGPEKAANSERGENSRQVSTIVRTLGTTVIAVVWLFSGATGSAGTDKPITTLHALERHSSLRWSVLLALIALGADLLQYFLSSVVWATYHWAVDQVDINDDFDPSDTMQISGSVRAGWAVLRVFRTALQLEYVLDLDPSKEWKLRRTALRTELARSSGQVDVDPPAWLNWPGTVCFFVKVVALGAAWVELFTYLRRL